MHAVTRHTSAHPQNVPENTQTLYCMRTIDPKQLFNIQLNTDPNTGRFNWKNHRISRMHAQSPIAHTQALYTQFDLRFRKTSGCHSGRLAALYYRIKSSFSGRNMLCVIIWIRLKSSNVERYCYLSRLSVRLRFPLCVTVTRSPIKCIAFRGVALRSNIHDCIWASVRQAIRAKKKTSDKPNAAEKKPHRALWV